MKEDKYILWGATGQAKVLADIIYSHGGIVSKVFDNREIICPLNNIEIGYGLNAFEAWLNTIENPKTYSAIAAIGGAHGFDRVEFYKLFRDKGLAVPSIFHKTSFVSQSAKLGKNVQVLANAFIGVDTIIGDASIINTKSSVDHECILGMGTHIAPGATLCGCITIGDFSMLGAGSTVLPKINIGSNVIIGAGSVVTKDIPDNMIAYGNPAKIIRRQEIVRR